MNVVWNGHIFHLPRLKKFASCKPLSCGRNNNEKLSLSLYLSISLPLYLSVSLTLFISISLSLHPSISISLFLNVYISIAISLYHSFFSRGFVPLEYLAWFRHQADQSNFERAHMTANHAIFCITSSRCTTLKLPAMRGGNEGNFVWIWSIIIINHVWFVQLMTVNYHICIL